ncbi:Rho GTPase-activating protein domain [Ceraceosorus bombacis]|uniref:Rho GTPase-activating protein domain n=1 Tax=Ceraceosorus bombacis TaxID=401625 RepID=A0A0P1BN17_9BASI|nr:Rho GTPase-activating protein domain [Ceraceosorus bombacis]
MPTLFSRRQRPAGSELGALRFGNGISSSDLLARAASPSDQDARPLPDVPGHDDLPATYQPEYRTPASGPSMTEFGAARSPTSKSPYMTASFGKRSEDRFGSSSLQASARKPNRSGTLPLVPLTATTPVTLGVASPTKGPGSVYAVQEQVEPYTYGYAHEGWDTQLDAAQVADLVMACGDQIRRRGIDSPLIFSSMALDVSPSNTGSLIKSYLAGLNDSDRNASQTTITGRADGTAQPESLPSRFLDEIRFANPHDLATVIKWAMARMGRIFAVPVPTPAKGGPGRKGELEEETIVVQQRGFLELEHYMAWREEERNRDFPPTAFSAFIDLLTDTSASLLLTTLFSLLSSTSSYSHKNGMTPSKISRIFGALIFGLPEDDTFERTYDSYVRAGNATEHLLHAYIRDISTMEALPMRLADHIKGYPKMLSTELNHPARHVQGVPITQVERQVRLYSADLVQTAGEIDLTNDSEEWAACCSDSDYHGQHPQLSDRFRKLVNLRGGTGQGRKGEVNTIGRSASQILRAGDLEFEAYESVSAKDWGDFMLDGFAAPDQSKLAFDLRESERKARHKRQSMAWDKFEEQGFVATDDGLREVLSFDDGLKEDMRKWPSQRAELMEQLRNQVKKLPPFPYDTTPVCVASPSRDGSEHSGQWQEYPISRMDDLFAECWADYCLGSGWSNRDELTHRNANFVVVQYKSRPAPWTVGKGASSASASLPTSVSVRDHNEFGEAIQADDRTDAAWFVVQEIVPSQYRSDLDAAGRLKRRSKAYVRKFNVFKRMWKDRSEESLPYNPNDPFRPGVGGMTKQLRLPDPAATSRAFDIERSTTYTTVRTRDQRRADAGVVPNASYDRSSPLPSGAVTPSNEEPAAGRLLNHLRSRTRRGRSGHENSYGDEEGVAPAVPPKHSATLPAAMRPVENQARASDVSNGLVRKSSWSSADFETRSVHDPDMAALNFSDGPPSGGRVRNALRRDPRRESKDDSWLDVMVKANESRMTGQDAPPPGIKPKAADGSTPSPGHGVAPLPANSSRPVTLPVRDASLPGGSSRSPAHNNTQLPASAPAHVQVAPTVVSPGPASAAAAIAAAGWSREPARNGVPAQDSDADFSLPYLQPHARDGLLTEVQATTRSPERSPQLTSPRSAGVKATPSASPTAKSSSTSAAHGEPHLARRSPPLDRMEVDGADDTRESTRSVIPAMPGPDASPAEKERVRQARIDAAKERARELRAGLQSVDVRKANTPQSPQKPVSPATTPNARPRVDPFSKNPTAGRVSAIASKFGGPGKAGIASPTNSEGIQRSPAKLPFPGSAISSPNPSPSKKPTGANGFTAFTNAPQSPSVAAAALVNDDADETESAAGRRSEDSAGATDTDSIYPDESASRYVRDDNERPLRLYSERENAEELESAEAEDHVMALRARYQPGMPLDNVAEESESMLSGSNF